MTFTEKGCQKALLPCSVVKPWPIWQRFSCTVFYEPWSGAVVRRPVCSLGAVLSMLKQRAVYFSHICLGLILCDSVCCMLCLLYLSRNELFTLHCYHVCVDAVKVKYFTLHCLSFLLDTFLPRVCLLEWISQLYMEWEACLQRLHMALSLSVFSPQSNFFTAGREGLLVKILSEWECGNNRAGLVLIQLEHCFKIIFAKKCIWLSAFQGPSTLVSGCSSAISYCSR